jgi:hypothetical protein
MTAPPSSGLSSGAKAGIGIGITLGVLDICFALGAWFFTLRHLRKSNSLSDAGGTAGENTGGTYGMGMKPELEALGRLPREGQYKDVPDAQQHELDSPRPIVLQEMDAGG